MARDHHRLPLLGAVDQLGELVLGLDDAVRSHPGEWLLAGHFVQPDPNALSFGGCLTPVIFGDTLNRVDISFDPVKRARTLAERGLDFADAGLVFAGRTATVPDTRRDYGEDRYITAGTLRGRRVVLVWTPRGAARRIISMRFAHASEENRWFE